MASPQRGRRKRRRRLRSYLRLARVHVRWLGHYLRGVVQHTIVALVVHVFVTACLAATCSHGCPLPLTV